MDLLDSSFTLTSDAQTASGGNAYCEPLMPSSYLVYAPSTVEEEVDSAWQALQADLSPAQEPTVPPPPEPKALSSQDVPHTKPTEVRPNTPPTHAVLPALLVYNISPERIAAPQLKKPSPLKYEAYESDSDTSRGSIPESDVSIDVQRKRKWAIVEKMKAEREASVVVDGAAKLGPNGHLLTVPAGPDDGEVSMAMSAFALAGDCSQIFDEQGSFLVANNESSVDLSRVFPGDISSISASNPDDMDESAIFDQQFAGSIKLDQFCLAELKSTVQSRADKADRGLLFSSTASYKEHRDSPRRPRVVSMLAEAIVEENDSTPERGGAANSPRYSSEGESSGDIAAMLNNWKGLEADTREILLVAPPTAVINQESTQTYGMSFKSPDKSVSGPVPLPRPPVSTKGATPRASTFAQYRTSSSSALCSLTASLSSTSIAEETEHPVSEAFLTASSRIIPSSASKSSHVRQRLELLAARQAQPRITPVSSLRSSPYSARLTGANLSLPKRPSSQPTVDEHDVVFGSRAEIAGIATPGMHSKLAPPRRLSMRPPAPIAKLDFTVLASSASTSKDTLRSPRKESTTEKLERAKEERQLAAAKRSPIKKPADPRIPSTGGARARPSIGGPKSSLASSVGSSTVTASTSFARDAARPRMSTAEMPKKPLGLARPSVVTKPFVPSIPAPRPSRYSLSSASLVSTTRPGTHQLSSSLSSSTATLRPSPAKASRPLSTASVRPSWQILSAPVTTIPASGSRTAGPSLKRASSTMSRPPLVGMQVPAAGGTVDPQGKATGGRARPSISGSRSMGRLA